MSNKNNNNNNIYNRLLFGVGTVAVGISGYYLVKYLISEHDRDLEKLKKQKKLAHIVRHQFQSKKNEILSELVNLTLFNGEELDKIYNKFCSYKVNSNDEHGVLDHQEFSNLYSNTLDVHSRKVTEAMFLFWDRNRDGQIDFIELVKALDTVANGTKIEKLRLFFHTYDLDHDGYIDQNEFKEVLKAFSHGLMTHEEANKHMKDFFRKADKSHDHRVSFSEFKSFIQSPEFEAGDDANVSEFIDRFVKAFDIEMN